MEKANENIIGFPVSARGLHGDVNLGFALLRSKRHGSYMACANPHSVVTAFRDEAFSKALRDADLLVPDGVGIVLAAKILGLAIKERVAGYEFFVEFSKRASEIGTIRYFFLGSTETVLQNIVSRMAREFPAIEIAGTLSPPFKDESSDKENQDMLQVINASKTDILWVGMTAPKQEKWIHANRNMLEVPLACGIGAVFDFFAGTKPRSAKWLQKLGLEWFPRFLREPQRLWRRNIISTPLFLMAVIRQRFSGVDGH